MFNLFRRSPTYSDQQFSDLSLSLFLEFNNPTYKRELLDKEKLDYSIRSLEHIDGYLAAVHAERPQEHERFPVVLRCGAYVGEVIRRHSLKEMHWVTFSEAATYSKSARQLGHSLETAGILWISPETMCFPLSKVSKFIDNGDEDSVLFFAQVLLRPNGP